MTPGSRKPISRRSLCRRFGALAGLAILSPGRARDATAKENKAAKKKRPRDILPPTQFYTMRPFTLPLMEDGRVIEHFTLVVALELADEDVRSEVYHLTPRLRDVMYRLLFQMVTFRLKGSGLPPVDIFKRNLTKVVAKVAGPDLVTSLLVQQAFKRKLR